MKGIKLLLLSLIMTFSITSFSQVAIVDSAKVVTNAVTDVNSSLHATELLIDKYTGKLEATIVSLAQALKQPAEHVYKVLIKQQYVKAVIGLFMLLVIILFITLTIKFANNIEDWSDLKAKKNKSKISGGIFVASIIFGIIFLITFFVAEYPQDIIQGFVNPEYRAIQEIIQAFK